jgi:CheY-specific phosphatase CheX
MSPEAPILELDGVAASAITEVLGTQFNLSAITSAAEMSTANQPQQCLVGSVKLTGSRVSGTVHLQLPQDFAAELTALLLGQHPANVSDEVAADVTGELCNWWQDASPRRSPQQAN